MDEIVAALAVKYPGQIAVVTKTINGTKYRVIYRYADTDTQTHEYGYWNTASGLVVSLVDTSTSAAAQQWDYTQLEDTLNNQTTEITDAISDGIQQIIDTENQTVSLPSVTVDASNNVSIDSVNSYNLSDVSFDFSTNTYTVNAYDITYNTTNNYYEYNYYTYNIQYTYNNTYVTYIGSTAEYQPTEYELYYELPDGRSSADLTEEDIAGLSFQFADCVNYKRSATDLSLRALYHFDGDTDDSSFWSTQGAFTWNTGASITYMESNAFNGALYLDENAHKFTITLPSNLGSQDFSIQWRYYQNSATTTNNNENYVMLGSTKLLGWSEQTLYNGSGTSIGDLSVGTWQELALVRQSGTLYLYHNGVKLTSLSVSTVFNNQLVFYLGANSRAYSMIDELRVVNFAIAESGAVYTPTAVPYDTNSVLILPDGAVPIADEYWEWDKTIKPTWSLDCTAGYISVSSYTSYSGSSGYCFADPSYGTFYKTLDTVSVYDGYVNFLGSSSSLSGSVLSELVFKYDDNDDNYHPYYYSKSSGTFFIPCGLSSGITYTLTLVSTDLEQYSLTFTLPYYSARNDGVLSSQTASFDWGSFGISTTARNSSVLYGFLIDVLPGVSLDLVYMELVTGSTPNTGHRKVSCIYDSTEIQSNTAAIQTDIPIHGYTVGGVRPTFPVRGDVWFPVEGSRITGVQVYNGQAWEETNARYWTGTRWIPIYAFDLVTLEDMWDVSSSTGEDVTPSITSEYSFWNWWKNAWNSFTDKLFSVLGDGGGDGSGTVSDDIFPPEEETEDDEGWTAFDLLVALKDGSWAIVKGTVKTAFGGVKDIVTSVASIGEFFVAVGSLSETIKGLG